MQGRCPAYYVVALILWKVGRVGLGTGSGMVYYHQKSKRVEGAPLLMPPFCRAAMDNIPIIFLWGLIGHVTCSNLL